MENLCLTFKHISTVYHGRGAQIPGAWSPAHYIVYRDACCFQHNYCSIFLYIQKCVSVQMHRAEVAREQ
jgi:hypothetical protein